MTTVTSTDLQRDLTALLDRVEAGESIIVVRDDRAIAELRPATPAAALRPIGLAKGQFVVPDDFDEPLPESVLRELQLNNGKLRLPTPEQLTELERRIADSDANPEDCVPWEEVRAAALARLWDCSRSRAEPGNENRNQIPAATASLVAATGTTPISGD